MEEFQYCFDPLSYDEIDWDETTKEFLKIKDFHQWHMEVNNIPLKELVNNLHDLDQVCDWIHGCRMQISADVELMIKYHLYNENYEMIQPLKDKVSQLRVEALEIEMKLER